MARAMGRRGGRARARRLSAERRSQIAALGGQARQRSLLAARRIAENLRYAAAAIELRGGQARIVRMKTCTGRLPGLYPDHLLFDFPVPAATLAERAMTVKAGAVVLRVASEVDLLQLKKVARAQRSSPGDAEDIAFLEARRSSPR